MDPTRQAAAGLGLAAFSNLVFLAFFVSFGGFGPFAATMVVAVAGLALAAAGAAGLGHEEGPRRLAAGLAVAAAAYVAFLLLDLGSGDLYKVGHAVIALGLLQAAWFGLRAALDPADPARVLGGLQVSLLTAAAGAGVYVVLNLLDGLPEWLVGTVAALAGYLLAARALGALRDAARPEGAADDAPGAAAPAGAR